MTPYQEEALYNFLDNTAEPFKLENAVDYIQKAAPGNRGRLNTEVEAFINLQNLAFPDGEQRWVSRRGCFEPLTFVISPSRLELLNGILIPGHRCVPFANPALLPHEYSFFWQGKAIPFTTTEGPPEEFYPYYSIFGEEYAPQYVARDNSVNEKAFNDDPYDDPPEVSVKTLDMRNIYREVSLVPGDRFAVKTLDWKNGSFELTKVAAKEWSEADLETWLLAAEAGFEKSFSGLGPASSTEEQIAYAYWYGGPRMRQVPAYSLEEYLYQKTNKIELSAYGIESRFWYAGREIPDQDGLSTGNMRLDLTPIEALLCHLQIPVSEFVVQSYVRDSLYRERGDADLIIKRLIPFKVDLDIFDKTFFREYIENVLEEYLGYYNLFADKAMGPIRSRAAELHTAVIELFASLNKKEVDHSWLPRHTFIILSQIQAHTANILEDLDSDESLPETELSAIDNSLDSMVETYDDLKELVDEALTSFRRNKFSVIRPGSTHENITERLLQLSISSIDVWRRIIVPGNFNLAELHEIIQAVFKWRNTQNFQFCETTPVFRRLESTVCITELEKRGRIELLYEYGANWTVRIMLLSSYETAGQKNIRCVAGAETAPPEHITGPLRFKKLVSALDSGNEIERLAARQELGLEFDPDDFALEVCNRNLNAKFQPKS